jgi:general secretion pathway protein I
LKATCRHHRPGARDGVRHGFTLVEVLVALVVVAVALAAAMRVAGSAAVSTSDYRERLLARWVAANVLETARLEPALPPAGETSGEEVQAGQHFVWRRKVSSTPNPRFRRLDIEVGPPGQALATLTGFVMAGS